MLKKEFLTEPKQIHKLQTSGIPEKLLYQQFGEMLDTQLELWLSQGVRLVKKDDKFYFSTTIEKIEETTFCIVDIETNGSKIEKHQIIEIAAVKVKNGLITARYESLVYCKEINPVISELTGIFAEDTANAPNIKKVMYEFKEFIQDSLFVAHDTKFDYSFISQSMQKVGLEPLLNRSLCTLKLSERTIESYRYALVYLNKLLNLNINATHHRAMSDVLTTHELLKIATRNIEVEIVTAEDLIRFSNEAKQLKRPLMDPFFTAETKS